MQGSFLIFEPLLMRLSLTQTLFLGIMIDIFAKAAVGATPVSPQTREAANAWLNHFYISPKWLQNTNLGQTLMVYRPSVISLCLVHGDMGNLSTALHKHESLSEIERMDI